MTRITPIAVIAATLHASQALANPYDDCILQYMAGAQNQTAVYAIERACISKTSVPVPDTYQAALNAGSGAAYGTFNIGSGSLETGILISIKNSTPFDITEASVSISNKTTGVAKYYDVSRFIGILPAGTFLGGPAEPAFEQVIKAGQSARFFVRLDEVVPAAAQFDKLYQWGIAPVKGIPAN